MLLRRLSSIVKRARVVVPLRVKLHAGIAAVGGYSAELEVVVWSSLLSQATGLKAHHDRFR